MKRTVAVAAVPLIVLAPFLWTVEAGARAGRGGASGRRGSRSHSAPALPSSSPASPGTSDAPSAPAHSPPGSSGWGGMVGGLIAGGLLGSLLFGGGNGGRFGFTELAILGVLAFLLIRKMRSGQPEPAASALRSSFVAGRAIDARAAPGWGE